MSLMGYRIISFLPPPIYSILHTILETADWEQPMPFTIFYYGFPFRIRFTIFSIILIDIFFVGAMFLFS